MKPSMLEQMKGSLSTNPTKHELTEHVDRLHRKLEALAKTVRRVESERDDLIQELARKDRIISDLEG